MDNNHFRAKRLQINFCGFWFLIFKFKMGPFSRKCDDYLCLQITNVSVTKSS